MRSRSRTVKIFADVHLRLNRRRGAGLVAVHGSHHAIRLVDVGLRRLAGAPSRGGGSGDEAIPRPGQCRFAMEAERYAQNIRRIRLQNNGLALAVEFQALDGVLRQGTGCGENDSGENCKNG